MRRLLDARLLIALLLIVALDFRASPQIRPPVQFVRAIPLPGVTGRIDHMSIDLKRRRVWVAALGNGSVEVVSLTGNKVIRSIRDLSEPQGIVSLPDLNMIAVASGGDGTCTFFDAESLTVTRTLPLGDDADNIRYDTTQHRLYIGYASGALAVIDAPAQRRLADIPLTGHPESFQFDGGNRVFVNVPSSGKIEVVDRTIRKPVRTFDLTGDRRNFPMAIDQGHHRLFIGCRDPARLLILNTDSGTVKARLTIDGDCDDLFYDHRTQLIFISCGEGFLDLVKQLTPDQYVVRSRIKTAAGARTSLFVPELRQLFLAVPGKSHQPAAIWIYDVTS